MAIYLIRHGQSEFNAAEHHAGDPMIFDAPLTDLGKRQADVARDRIGGLGIRHVVTSPLTRAIQTALLVFGDTMPITVDATHREQCHSSCDVGRGPEHLSRDFPGMTFDHLEDHWWHKGPANEDGIPFEPDHVFEQRVRDFARLLEEAVTRPVAIVGHHNYFLELTGVSMRNCEVLAYEP